MGDFDTEDYLFKWTGRLYAVPSFLSGVARVLDLGGAFTVYNRNRTDDEADRASIRSDWFAVGDDLRYVIASEKEHSR